jgi:nucleotide-binding universal stress UspA family protein
MAAGMTGRVVAAVDGGPATRAILDVASALCEIFDATLDAVRVDEGVGSGPAAPFDGEPLRDVRGDVMTVLDGEALRSDVIAVVLGARTLPGATATLGHVPDHVIANAPGMVVLVPPGLPPERSNLGRLLVPVKGDAALSPAVARVIGAFEGCGRAAIGLHVINPETAPPHADRWQDPELWSRRFWRRCAPSIADHHIGTGGVADATLEMIATHGVDGVLLEWHQRFDHDHAAVVRDLLRRAPIPVLLLPDRRTQEPMTPWIAPDQPAP